MPVAIPPELKPITAYIRRAEELDADKSDPNHRIIAFYCRSYAMEKAINLASTGGEAVQSFLMNLMQELENTKATIAVSKEEAKVLCEGFAVNIFHRADDQDRSEDNNNYRETARMFYNSSTFFDILEQFGSLDDEINSKRTYSKWKATEIMKALKEGRTPTPGGYGGDDAPKTTTVNDDVPPPSLSSLSVGLSDQNPSNNQVNQGNLSPSGFSLPTVPTSTVPNVSRDLPTVPGMNFQMPQQPQYGLQQPPQQTFQPPQQTFQPPQQTQPPPQQIFQPHSHQPAANYVPPPKGTNYQSNIADALELCAFAMSALKHNDTKTGKERLQAALNML